MAIQGAENRFTGDQWQGTGDRFRRSGVDLNFGLLDVKFHRYGYQQGLVGEQVIPFSLIPPSGIWQPYRGILPDAMRPALPVPWPWE